MRKTPIYGSEKGIGILCFDAHWNRHSLEIDDQKKCILMDTFLSLVSILNVLIVRPNRFNVDQKNNFMVRFLSGIYVF